MATLDIKLKKANKVYKEGELVKGAICIDAGRSEVAHQGITLMMEGSVNLQLSAKSVGLFEAFYSSLKPMQLINYSLDIAKPGKLPSGRTEIPFEIPLKPKGNKELYETYHGVFVNIQYSLKAEMKRPLLAKDLQKTCEFIVEYSEKIKKIVLEFEQARRESKSDTLTEAGRDRCNPQGVEGTQTEQQRSDDTWQQGSGDAQEQQRSDDIPKQPGSDNTPEQQRSINTPTIELDEEEEQDKAKSTPKPVQFTISPETLTNVKEKQNVPKFKVKGKLDSAVMCITKPLRGELTVEHCDTQIKSIEIQLVRVETCGCAEGYAKDATEIQNIQIADGDVCRGISIPIWMIFPRLFTCPTLSTNNFKVDFEINIVIVFQDNHLVTENFPIKLTRF